MLNHVFSVINSVPIIFVVLRLIPTVESIKAQALVDTKVLKPLGIKAFLFFQVTGSFECFNGHLCHTMIIGMIHRSARSREH